MAIPTVQARPSLYMLGDDRSIEQLTLPTGVELATDKQPRFAIMNQRVIMVHSPTHSLIIDGLGAVRKLITSAPLTAATVAAGAGTGITGSVNVMVAFATLNGDGSIRTMIPFGPVSNSVTLANQNISVTALPVSTDAEVNARVIIRNVAGGSVYFEALIVPDNSSTTATLSLTDAALPTLPTDTDTFVPPGSDNVSRARLVCEWKGALWLVSDQLDEIDDLVFSRDGEFWKFRLEDALLAPPRGGDAFGATAFLKRRDELGVGRRGRLPKVIGSDPETFEVKEVVEASGPCSQEACQVIRDRAFYLTMEDGVWVWDASGAKCITEGDVHPWFTTDNYFNRSRFPYAKSRINPHGPTFDLCLATVGSDREDTWVSYHINEGKWLGPHETDAFAEIGCAGQVADEDVLKFSLFGDTEGYLWRAERTLMDDDGEAIVLEIIGKHHGNAVVAKRNWLQPSVTIKAQDSGTIELFASIGEVPANDAPPVET